MVAMVATVAVNEVMRGVGMVLGEYDLDLCPSFDRHGTGAVTVDDLMRAISAVLDGCPGTPGPSPTASTPTPVSPTPIGTPPPTATSTVNQAPSLPAASIYRTYAGAPIALPLGVVDPEGGPLRCLADALPSGATLDGNVLRWTPTDAQLGPIHVPFSCSDTADPPLTAAGQLTFKVAPLDPCSRPSCDPATGCTNALPPVDAPCCTAELLPRVAEPQARCPEGKVAFLGRNNSGFGRLQNCDRLRVRNFAQSGAQVSFHVEARCLRTDDDVDVSVRIETKDRVLVNASRRVFLHVDETKNSPPGHREHRGHTLRVAPIPCRPPTTVAAVVDHPATPAARRPSE